MFRSIRRVIARRDVVAVFALAVINIAIGKRGSTDAGAFYVGNNSLAWSIDC